jgi:hypothetical protein
MQFETIYRCNRCRGGTPALYAINTGTVTGVPYPAPSEMGTLCLYCARDDADDIQRKKSGYKGGE